MEAWEDTFAAAIGEDAITPEELGIVLRLSRDVAHRAERKLAPVSAYLAGVYAGRMAAAGAGTRTETLRVAERVARELLPEAPDDDGAA